MSGTLFCYGDRAYVSELDLFRAHGVSSEETEPFIFETESPPETLYSVTEGDGPWIITDDGDRALAHFAEIGGVLTSIFTVTAGGALLASPNECHSNEWPQMTLKRLPT